MYGYDPATDDQKLRYGAMITAMDAALGRVLVTGPGQRGLGALPFDQRSGRDHGHFHAETQPGGRPQARIHPLERTRQRIRTNLTARGSSGQRSNSPGTCVARNLKSPDEDGDARPQETLSQSKSLCAVCAYLRSMSSPPQERGSEFIRGH